MQRTVTRVKNGFTLIELMISLVVLVVLITVAIPGMQGLINSGRLSAAANELSAAVQLARVEALRRNRSVVLCNSETLTACSNSDAWTGWLIFVDTNNNGIVDAGEDIVRTGSIDTPLVMRASDAISARGQQLTFLPSGLARGAAEDALLTAALSVCTPFTSPAANVRDVLISFGSRTSVRSRPTAGVCTAAPPDS